MTPNTSSLPSSKMIRTYALAWTLGYWALYFVFRSFFPDKVLADAGEIQEIIEGARSGVTGSYYMMASLYGMLPFALTNTLVGLFNGWILYRIICCSRTYLGAFLLVPIVAPFILANLQAPTKETLVLAMSMIILHFVSRARSEMKAFGLILILYALYGAIVREYYMIILAVFTAVVAFAKTPMPLRLVFPLLGVIVLLLIPETVFQSIQGARDEVNFWAVTGGAHNPIRTLFFNPFPPDSLTHFLGNYGYAFALLNFPFLFYFTPKELLMFFNIVFFAWLMLRGLRALQGPMWMLPALFLSHVSTLILFEPDLGSYYRHFSSAIWYLLPVFALYEEQKALALTKEMPPMEEQAQ